MIITLIWEKIPNKAFLQKQRKVNSTDNPWMWCFSLWNNTHQLLFLFNTTPLSNWFVRQAFLQRQIVFIQRFISRSVRACHVQFHPCKTHIKSLFSCAYHNYRTKNCFFSDNWLKSPYKWLLQPLISVHYFLNNLKTSTTKYFCLWMERNCFC